MLKKINAYDRALTDIQERLTMLGELAEHCLSDAMRSFCEQNTELAKEITARDEVVDTIDEALELSSLELISIQQPIDYDLRFLAAAMRISRELERIADYSCDIAEATLESQRANLTLNPPDNLTRLADSVQRMLRKALKAYFENDLIAARELDDDDNMADRLFNILLRELTNSMKQGPEYVDQASAMLLVARYLERIGDHSVNIAEMCIFKETGERRPFKHNPETGQ